MKRALLVAALVVSMVAPVVPASSPPQPLCSVCDDGFERAADGSGLDVTVTNSAVTVRVREDGTGEWTVENRVQNESTASRLETDADLLGEIVERALYEGGWKPDPDRLSNVSARVEQRTIVVTFSHDSFADRVGNGALLVEYVHAGGSRSGYGLDADRFSVVGPDGAVVVNDPASGRVSEDGDAPEVAWVNDEEDDYYYGPETYLEDTYVAFGPSDGLAQRGAVTLAIAERTLPVVLSNVGFLTPAAILLVVGLAGLRVLGRTRFVPADPDSFAVGAFGVGLLALAHPLYAGVVPLVGDDTPILFPLGSAYVLVGGSALALARSRAREIPWWVLLAPAVVTPLLAAVVASALSYPTTPWDASDAIWLGGPFATLFPLGYAVRRGDGRARWVATATTLVAAALLTVKFVTFTEAPFAGGLVTILASALVILGLLFGLPLYLLGVSLASGPDKVVGQ